MNMVYASICFYLPQFLKKILFILFLGRGEGREKEWERNISVWLSLVHPQLETWPATQACALTGNRTGDPLVHWLVQNSLSHTSQGSSLIYFFSALEFSKYRSFTSLVKSIPRYFIFLLAKINEIFSQFLFLIFHCWCTKMCLVSEYCLCIPFFCWIHLLG